MSYPPFSPPLMVPPDPPTPEEWAGFQRLRRQRLLWSYAAAISFVLFAEPQLYFLFSSASRASNTLSLPDGPIEALIQSGVIVFVLLVGAFYFFYNLGTRIGRLDTLWMLGLPGAAGMVNAINAIMRTTGPTQIFVAGTLLVALLHLVCLSELGAIRESITTFRQRFNLGDIPAPPPPPPETIDSLNVDKGWDEGAPTPRP